jgi:alcohol dehydrogenase class IV
VALARYRQLGPLLTGRADAVAGDALAWVEALCRTLEVPGLARHGMTADDVPALVAKARAASSMKGNPIVLTEQELGEIATAAL